MSLPEGFVQIELFSSNEEMGIAKPKKKFKPKEKDYTTNKNPMVKKYGFTWIGAKCGVNTRKTKPCKHYNPKTNECALRIKEHWTLRQKDFVRNWDACGMYQPRREGDA